MKTITLSDAAYQRLASWKKGKNDTFSLVVERVVPPKGTIEAAIRGASQLPNLSDQEFEMLEKAINQTRHKMDFPWN